MMHCHGAIFSGGWRGLVGQIHEESFKELGNDFSYETKEEHGRINDGVHSLISFSLKDKHS